MTAVTADTAAADSGAVPFKRGKKKLMIMVAAVLALVLAAGGGGVWYLKKKAAHAAAALAAGEDEAGAEATQASAKPDAKSVPVYLPLDPFIVNLADRDVDRYAQIGITLELESPVFADQVKAYMPAVRNAILLILAQKSSRELLGRAGKEELAEEIMRESVRPMGIEILAPEPVTLAPVVVASASSASASASGAEKTAQDEAVPIKPKMKRNAVRNPVQHVHFSSFIIQ
ncbi:MAG: flagellar basal body-associated FliL family protein [Caldimonas sp.]